MQARSYGVAARSSSRSRSTRTSGTSCCDPSGPGPGPRRHASRLPRAMMPRYCDALPPNVRDPQIIGDIINDLHCVFEKTFGESANYRTKYKTIQCDLENLQDALDQCEDCRIKLQREVLKLRAELKAAQKAFQEEIQRRICLEGFVTKLKAQLSQLEAIVDADALEKNQLANCLKEAKQKLKELAGIVECLEIERDQLLRDCREFEDWRSREEENSLASSGRCEELGIALAKCCRANEELQGQIKALKEENKRLADEVARLKLEKCRIIEELKRERACWSAEKDGFQKMIASLRKAYDDLMAKNQEICRRMNEIVGAHHSEMESLRKELERLRKLFECEKAGREKLQKALRDCEERKASLLRRQQGQRTTTIDLSNFDPCDPVFLAQFSSQAQGPSDQKSSPSTASTSGTDATAAASARIAVLEKQLREAQASLNEKTVALERSQKEVEQLRVLKRNLEVDAMLQRVKSENLATSRRS